MKIELMVTALMMLTICSALYRAGHGELKLETKTAIWQWEPWQHSGNHSFLLAWRSWLQFHNAADLKKLTWTPSSIWTKFGTRKRFEEVKMVYKIWVLTPYTGYTLNTVKVMMLMTNSYEYSATQFSKTWEVGFIVWSGFQWHQELDLFMEHSSKLENHLRMPFA